jgi:hypothetical protein
VNNPLRSERDAFRMVLLAVAYFGLIAIGLKIERWLGLAVFVVLTAGALAWVLHGRRREPAERIAPSRGRSGELRVLVVAAGGVPGLEDVLRERAGGRRTVVQVVGPAPGGDLAERLVALRAAGLDATGETVEGDPLPAVEDAVRRFAPDEIVIASGESGEPGWPGPGFVERARARFDVPVLGIGGETEATA